MDFNNDSGEWTNLSPIHHESTRLLQHNESTKQSVGTADRSTTTYTISSSESRPHPGYSKPGASVAHVHDVRLTAPAITRSTHGVDIQIHAG